MSHCPLLHDDPLPSWAGFPPDLCSLRNGPGWPPSKEGALPALRPPRRHPESGPGLRQEQTSRARTAGAPEPASAREESGHRRLGQCRGPPQPLSGCLTGVRVLTAGPPLGQGGRKRIWHIPHNTCPAHGGIPEGCCCPSRTEPPHEASTGTSRATASRTDVCGGRSRSTSQETSCRQETHLSLGPAPQ